MSGSQIRPPREESPEESADDVEEDGGCGNAGNNNNNGSNEEGEAEYFETARKILNRSKGSATSSPSPTSPRTSTPPSGRTGGMGGSMIVRRERGGPSQAEAKGATHVPGGYDVDDEVGKLVSICQRLCGGKGKGEFTFKDIFYDEEAESTFESLMGTLKAAKRRGIISYEPPLLLQGAHDDERIVFHGGPK